VRHNLPMMTIRQRYQRGTIRLRHGKVYGEWRGELKDGKRAHLSVLLGQQTKGKSKAAWRDDLRQHIEKYYRSLAAPAVDSSITVAAFVERVFLPAYEARWAKTTARALRSALKHHVLAPLGARPLCSILKADVVALLNDMRAAGYAKRSIRIVKWLLTAIFEEAIDNDLVAKTPVRRIRLTNIPDGAETRPLTEDEVRRIYASTEGAVRLIWRLMIGCGLRPGELAALRRDDVGDVLRIDEAYELGEFGKTKTRTVRYVPLSTSLRAELAAWMKGGGASGAVLFSREDGRPMTVAYMRDQVQNATREAAGIPDLTLRQARCTFGTLLAGDVKDVQELLGHKGVEMTMKHYKKAINARQVETVEELDRRLTRPALKIVGGKR